MESKRSTPFELKKILREDRKTGIGVRNSLDRTNRQKKP